MKQLLFLREIRNLVPKVSGLCWEPRNQTLQIFTFVLEAFSTEVEIYPALMVCLVFLQKDERVSVVRRPAEAGGDAEDGEH